MAAQSAEFIKAPEGAIQTLPVSISNRIANSDIAIELCTEDDALQIVRLPTFNSHMSSKSERKMEQI